MREKSGNLLACPISKSSNNDAYNDICRATGQQCPYYADEGMSVCKSKAKCLAYFAKRWSKVDKNEVMKLILSDEKSRAGEKSKYTNTLKTDKSIHEAHALEVNEENDIFVEELEAALKKHEDIKEDEEES